MSYELLEPWPPFFNKIQDFLVNRGSACIQVWLENEEPEMITVITRLGPR